MTRELHVGWAPTSEAVARRVLQWASVGSDDTVYELGCGDATVAVEAARLGAARVVCVEQDRELVQRARDKVGAAGISDRVRVVQGDLFGVNVTAATVLYLFLLPEMLAALRPRLARELRPGSRVVSQAFEVHGWPCGERLVEQDVLFLRWRMPALAEASEETAVDDSEESIVDHMLECRVNAEADDDEWRPLAADDELSVELSGRTASRPRTLLARLLAGGSVALLGLIVLLAIVVRVRRRRLVGRRAKKE